MPAMCSHLLLFFYRKGTKSFQSRNTNLNFLIWKVHHLTTSSSFSFVHVEVPEGSPARFSLNEAIIFGMLVLRGFFNCRALASGKSKNSSSLTGFIGTKKEAIIELKTGIHSLV